MAARKFDIGDLLPQGSKVESVSIKAPEDPDDKAARLRREFWSFMVKELAAYIVAFLFLIVIGGYCCFVVAHHGVGSPEARVGFPLITTLFGGVVGIVLLQTEWEERPTRISYNLEWRFSHGQEDPQAFHRPGEGRHPAAPSPRTHPHRRPV